MTKAEFARYIQIITGKNSDGEELKQFIQLAHLHGGKKILNDLKLCHLQDITAEEYLNKAKVVFPVYEDILKDNLWAEIIAQISTQEPQNG